MKLRPYQSEAVTKTLEAWQESPSALIVMATGLGKTITFSEIIKTRTDAQQATDGLSFNNGNRAIVIAHREELIYQAANKIKAVTGEMPEIEMADQRADMHMFRRAKCIVGSVQTMQNGRLHRFDPKDFGTLVIDEAHHATAKTYRNIIKWFTQNEKLRVLGVTATPDRGDEEALGQVFDSVPYCYEIIDGIKDGWLVPIEQQSVVVDGLDFSQVRTTAGDLNQKDLAAVMVEEGPLHEIAHPTIDIAAGRRTLVFAASLAHAERLCEIFNRHEAGCARWVHGGTPKEDRRQMLKDYTAGKFQFLVNVGVATEGFDEPGIEVVAVARPTKSRALYAQMAGRGTRVHPDAGIEGDEKTPEDRRSLIAFSCKPKLMLVDFVGNSGRHKLMSAADILGGKVSDEAIERAQEKAKESGAPVDMLDALEEAERELIEERKREAEKKRKELKAKAEYKLQSVDPFDVFDIQPEKARGWDRAKKPTDRMLQVLQKNGIDTDGKTFAECKQLIQEIISRSQRNLCTYKQARYLRSQGVDATGMTFEQASNKITELKGGSGGFRPYRPNRVEQAA